MNKQRPIIKILPYLSFIWVVYFQSVMVYGQIQSPSAPSFTGHTPITPQHSRIQAPEYRSPNRVHGQTTTKRDRHAEVQAILNETKNERNKINYDLPIYVNHSESRYYRDAFQKLKSAHDSTFSLKSSVFLIENAFYGNQMNINGLDTAIQEIGKFVLSVMEENGLDTTNNLVKNLMLFRLFSDTLESKELDLRHMPFNYNFDDYMGYEDWRNMFVEKLLRTNEGQCHSLPLLYLMIAEEIGAEAYLAMSPNHSYIKFQDERGGWINMELTNGMLTTDAFVMQSGYIKTEALQNGIYMQPLKTRQLRSQMLVDLAQGYIAKFGYDAFVETVINEAISLNSTNVMAHQVLSDYRTGKFLYIAGQLRLTDMTMNRLEQYPKAKAAYQEMLAQYETLDNLGYEQMPLDDYEKWLNSLQDAKLKQESDDIEINLDLNSLKN